MLKHMQLLILASALLLTACQQASSINEQQAIATKLTQQNGHYQIMRQDKPYFIKGAGGSSNMALLKASGGNSIRTWSSKNADKILVEAQQHGLTVMLGLSLGHERHGFDYNDTKAVAAQKQAVREQVLKYKDYPALLAWGIGNEVDLFYTNTDVWYAIEDIASMIRELDPNHLITTVTAGIDKTKADLIMQRVPSIDYLSVNIYGGLETLPQHLLDIGYNGAYVVTEWGPTGHWQIDKTSWSAPIEQTSTEKAASYRSRYQGGIASAPKRALGSYAFLWGQKQETTPTWYGVFTEKGQPNEVVDSLHYLWSGNWPEQRAPSIADFRINDLHASDSIQLTAAQSYQAKVDILLHQPSDLHITWEILPESTDIKAGGDPESRPQPLNNLVNSQDKDGALSFNAPTTVGAYRLFVAISNGNNQVANANIPFYVLE
ncbi:glycoside hydrolase family 2 TIM barrel-domain containing protein [Alteromonadaceae bacterium BrNp21-10]|nr:glycoside hydrolase family 2 TIM barrel-domain containing protein [Alteromonadaceae bacterium BrNp21-10]